jgi:FecR protein
VAWLVNAQNCAWTDGDPPGDIRPGRTLRIDRGLAEIQFRCGARVVVEGPARLEFLSATSARLHEGKLAARVPPDATGFEILCPQGKVIDLGTEFGVSVSPSGAADVYVFEGRVEAYPSGGRPTAKVDLTRRQGARLAAGAVTVGPADPTQFVRQIVPAVSSVPRVRELTFAASVDGSIQDAGGMGTGLTHRLPGTGNAIAPNDPNLRLVPEKGQLELTTTNSDLNTQYRLHRGEYLGLRLADLGFTGTEDFELAATFPSIPPLSGIGQLGLYCGTRSDRAIRGGVHVSDKSEGQFTQFLVNNPDGKDTDTCRVGLNEAGTTLRMILRRAGGKYSLIVENQTVGFANTLAIHHPDFLDGETDLYVGLFGANTQSDVRRTFAVKDVKVTVWTAAPTDR